MTEQRDKALAKKGQTVGLVIALTMVLWLIANLAGPQLGLPGRYALLFDFAALAALLTMPSFRVAVGGVREAAHVAVVVAVVVADARH